MRARSCMLMLVVIIIIGGVWCACGILVRVCCCDRRVCVGVAAAARTYTFCCLCCFVRVVYARVLCTQFVVEDAVVVVVVGSTFESQRAETRMRCLARFMFDAYARCCVTYSTMSNIVHTHHVDVIVSVIVLLISLGFYSSILAEYVCDLIPPHSLTGNLIYRFRINIRAGCLRSIIQIQISSLWQRSAYHPPNGMCFVQVGNEESAFLYTHHTKKAFTWNAHFT